MSGFPSATADLLPPAVRSAASDDPARLRLLDALLRAVDGQRDLLARRIDGLWQELFVDSCSDDSLPYLGALLGLPPDATRLEIANAIALRRRKGTPAALEDFAEVLTGWTARVIEGWQVTAWAQRLGHPPPLRTSVLALRGPDLARVGGAFERARRTVDVRRRWRPAAADVVVWPWTVRTFRETAPHPLPEPARYALHPLGDDAPLYVAPRGLALGSDITGSTAAARTTTESDAPVRVTYDVLLALADEGEIALGDLWTVAASHPLADPGGTDDPPLIRITVDDVPIPWAAVRFGSLPRGAAPAAAPPAGGAIVDIVRGHIALDPALPGTVRCSWHRAEAGSLGALASDAATDPAARVVVEVDPRRAGVNGIVGTLDAAFAAAQARSAALGLTADASQPGRQDVEIRLLTSDRLAAPAPVALTPLAPRWRIVAPRFMTPTIVGDLDIDLEDGCLTIEGLLVAGDVRIGDETRAVALRSLTMDAAAGSRVRVSQAAWRTALEIDRCLLGGLTCELSAHAVRIRDSVVDGRGTPHRMCDAAPAPAGSGAAVEAANRFAPELDVAGATFLGTVATEAIRAADSVFADGLTVVQTQTGCLRHCDVGPTDPATLPPTYRCGPFAAARFASTQVGSAAYAALPLDGSDARTAAASNGGEIGAYHRDRRPERARRLRDRIAEFVPLGIDVTVTLSPWEEP